MRSLSPMSLLGVFQTWIYRRVKRIQRLYARHDRMVTHVGPGMGAVLLLLAGVTAYFEIHRITELLIGLVLLDVFAVVLLMGIGMLLVGICSGLKQDSHRRSILERAGMLLASLLVFVGMAAIGFGILIWYYQYVLWK
ncbi:hypothetical protein [Poriferisphaera sp. WC338]|uniref:hypothetical protein n=1 Tax=Poriferisphaera sp. WC338 TaxID=3425129 RepID=UPI003D81659E